MKTLAEYKQLTFNAGFSRTNIAISLGYTPEQLKILELHGILANSWKDTLKGKLNPRIGIGISFNF